MIAVDVIHSDTPDVFQALVLPQQHPGTFKYIQNQFANLAQQVSAGAGEFYQRAKQGFQAFYDPQSQHNTRMALRSARSILCLNQISVLTTQESLQSAAPIMQRYIMADPVLREAYHAQHISGYSEQYVDLQPGVVREAHYDWRRVNNTILQVNEENWVATTYYEELREGDRELSFDEQVDVAITSWAARDYLTQDIDPTDIYGGRR